MGVFAWFLSTRVDAWVWLGGVCGWGCVFRVCLLGLSCMFFPVSNLTKDRRGGVGGGRAPGLPS